MRTRCPMRADAIRLRRVPPLADPAPDSALHLGPLRRQAHRRLMVRTPAGRQPAVVVLARETGGAPARQDQVHEAGGAQRRTPSTAAGPPQLGGPPSGS